MLPTVTSTEELEGTGQAEEDMEMLRWFMVLSLVVSMLDGKAMHMLMTEPTRVLPMMR